MVSASELDGIIYNGRWNLWDMQCPSGLIHSKWFTLALHCYKGTLRNSTYFFCLVLTPSQFMVVKNLWNQSGGYSAQLITSPWNVTVMGFVLSFILLCNFLTSLLFHTVTLSLGHGPSHIAFSALLKLKKEKGDYNLNVPLQLVCHNVHEEWFGWQKKCKTNQRMQWECTHSELRKVPPLVGSPAHYPHIPFMASLWIRPGLGWP